MLPEGVIDNTLDDDYKIDCNEPPQNIGGQNLNSTIVSNNSKTPNHEIMLPERVMPAAHEGCLRHTKDACGTRRGERRMSLSLLKVLATVDASTKECCLRQLLDRSRCSHRKP